MFLNKGQQYNMLKLFCKLLAVQQQQYILLYYFDGAANPGNHCQAHERHENHQ